MNIGKKLTALLLLAAMVLSFAGCSFTWLGKGADDTTACFQIKEPETKEVPETTEVPETEAPETEVPETEAPKTEAPETENPQIKEKKIDENGTYTQKDDVALYIHTYKKLPKNFITKKEAEKLGWTGGSLEKYAKGKCIGGTYFGNYEGVLPEKEGRTYTECDIDTLGKKTRGAKRIVFSNDGLIYYTEDHYETFELLYGEE